MHALGNQIKLNFGNSGTDLLRLGIMQRANLLPPGEASALAKVRKKKPGCSSEAAGQPGWLRLRSVTD